MGLTFSDNTHAISRNAVIAAAPTQISVYCWIRHTAHAVGDEDNIVCIGGAAAAHDVYFDNSTAFHRIVWDVDFSTTNGRFLVDLNVPAGGIPIAIASDEWWWVALTYDASSTANAPVAYTYRPSTGTWVSQTFTVGTAPAGTFTAGTNVDVLWGNDLSRGFDLEGSLAWVGLHNVVLTEGELRTACRLGHAFRGAVELRRFRSTSDVASLTPTADAGVVEGTPPQVDRDPPLSVRRLNRVRWQGAGLVALQVDPDSIATAEEVYSPTLEPGAATVAPTDVATAEEVYQPTVEPGAVSIDVDPSIPTSEEVYQPTIEGGAGQAFPDHIASAEEVYSPTLEPGPVQLDPDSIATAEDVYLPSLGIAAAPDHIGTAEAVYSPAVEPGEATIAPDHIATGEEVYQPDLDSDLSISPSFIGTAEAVYSPEVAEQTEQEIDPDAILTEEAVYHPAVVVGRDPAIYARGVRPVEAHVRLRAPGGYWTEVGKDVARGIVHEGLTVTVNRSGPDTCSFTLRRDPTRGYVDLGAFNEAEVIVSGERLWAGRIRETPGQSGDDYSLAFQGEGIQYHADDDLISRGYVHQRLSDWQDVRSAAGTSRLADRWWSPPVVINDRGRITIGYPTGTAYQPQRAVGVRLDLGAHGPGARTTEIHCWAENPHAFQSVYIRGHNEPDALYTADAEDFGQGGGLGAAAGFASVSTDPNNPSLLGGDTSGAGYRYVSIFLWGESGTGTTGLDHMLHIDRIVVASDGDYELNIDSLLTASDVVADVVGAGALPLASDSLDEVETTSFTIPHYWPGGFATARELMDGVNAFHDYDLGIDADRRVFFRAPPEVPELEVGAWAGGELADASAGSGQDTYNKVVASATGPDGGTIEVVRYAADAVPESVRLSRLATPSNGDFDSSTTGWTMTTGDAITRQTSVSGGAGIYSGSAVAELDVSIDGLWVGYTTLSGLEVGRIYSVAIAHTIVGGAPVPGFRLRLAVVDGGEVKAQQTTTAQGNGSWEQLRLTFQASATSMTLYVTAWSNSNVYVDAVRTYQVEVNAADRAGIIRAARLQVGAALTEAALEQIALIWLRAHVTTPFKGSLSVTGQGGVRRYRGGVGVPPHELLAYVGKLIRLSHVEDPDSGAWGRNAKIASVTYSHDDQRASVEIDNERHRLDTFLARLAALADQVG